MSVSSKLRRNSSVEFMEDVDHDVTFILFVRSLQNALRNFSSSSSSSTLLVVVVVVLKMS